MRLKNNRFGIPYQGSKRSIACDLLGVMLQKKPKAKYFFDLFGGGGAMSLCASDNGLITHYNEINKNLAGLLQACLDGIPLEWCRWISREEFNLKREEDSIEAEFIRNIWSFGNGRRAYLFGKDKEEWKQKGHRVILENDKESLLYFYEKTKCKAVLDLHSIFKNLKWQRRLEIWVNLVLKAEAIRVSGLGEIDSRWYQMGAKELFQTKAKDICLEIKKKIRAKIKRYKTIKEGIGRLEQVGGIREIEKLEHLQRFNQLERLNGLQVEISSIDYRQVKINTPIEETIIYCDPPYLNTEGYGAEFDHQDFIKWCLENSYSVFVSEYSNLEGLKVIYEKNKRALFDCNATNTISEKLLWNGK